MTGRSLLALGAVAAFAAAASLALAQSDPNYFVGAISKFQMTALGQAPTVNFVPASGTAQTLAFASWGSSAYDITLSGNCVFSLTPPTAPAGARQSIYLHVRNTAGAFTMTFPGGMKWHNGAAPSFTTTAGTVYEIEINTTDGGTTYTAR